MINLTTGPVDITPEVIEALNSPVVSHRSAEFTNMHETVIDQLCRHMAVKQAFLMTGSGTMANDVMLYQIKALSTNGIILINGEFGNRLGKQAERLHIDFVAVEHEWGIPFDASEIEESIITHKAQWVLCCHCETSTGQVIDIEMLRELNQKLGTRLYLDCMSTFGTMYISLDKIAMATASTAKGIGSLSGLAMVFSNVEIIEAPDVPVYLDLYHAQNCNGVPFTISSNLIAGLSAALNLGSRQQDWMHLDHFSQLIYNRLSAKAIIPFAQRVSRVFTIQLNDGSATELGTHLLQSGIKTSFESSYLKVRNWIQLALFSIYQEEEINYTLDIIEKFLTCAAHKKACSVA